MLSLLTSQRLLLEPATTEDIETLYALWTMPAVLEYLFDGVTMSHDRAVEHLDYYVSHHPEGLGMWLIYQCSDHAFIGEIGLAPSMGMVAFDPPLKNEIEFEIALHPDGWGKGYGEEALRTLLAYAFGTLKIPRVMGVADAPNKGSRRLQEKVGFVWQREVKGDLGPLVIYKRSPDVAD